MPVLLLPALAILASFTLDCTHRATGALHRAPSPPYRRADVEASSDETTENDGDEHVNEHSDVDHGDDDDDDDDDEDNSDGDGDGDNGSNHEDSSNGGDGGGDDSDGDDADDVSLIEMSSIRSRSGYHNLHWCS